ncbi:TonB-dependent receptor plug domain-containing protein [Reichenbachiella ulvae]|uniref:TonB-dependent receptor n=1 Tax=Reichenbachiella ulvae TaxID=2980104 RepID=A0ABT3CMY9_9BACT|nr:TonB-dependent receptor [Reichenbachiella ulvae]MCV9385076.1 TonB-dependent receptor [Reichenbachiella ulvae]
MSYVGYADAVLPEVLVGSAKEVVLSAELTEQVQALEGVTVSVDRDEPLNDMATVSAKVFNAEEAKRYAASFSDPARMAQSFAGVSTGDDASNEIIIRGNSPNWLLWRVEGVEVPSPNHFAEEGYSGGAVSILSANLLGSSDFYTGAFPSEYGNALSGVFDINLRKGNNRENEYTVQLGVLGVDLSAEGPFKKGYDGSFLFNYRYSTLSILNDLNFEISENALPNYQDLSFKLNFPTKRIGTFSLWGIGGLSDVHEEFIPSPELGENLEDGYRDVTETGMYATGLSHEIFLDQQSYVRTVISSSMSFSGEDYEEMNDQGQMRPEFNDDLQNRATRISSYYNRKLSSRTTMRAGGIYNSLNLNYYTRQREEDTDAWDTYLDSHDQTQLYQLYFQARYKFTNDISMTYGLHYSHFALSRDNSLEPRLGLSVALNHNQKVSIGAGLHSRHENLPVYFVKATDDLGNVSYPNGDLELTKAVHFVASYEKKFWEDFSFKAEGYFQYIMNLPVSTNPDELWSPIFGGLIPDDTLANIGKGRNYGLELTLQKYFTHNYYFLITSSLFDSKYQAADGKWRDSRYNVGFINNLVGGKEFQWGDNKMIGLNAKLIWSGGKRYVPVDLEQSILEGETVYQEGDLFPVQSKDYLRLDIGAELHFYKSKSEHVISLNVQNATNRMNIWYEDYDSVKEEVYLYPMAGLIPILNYRIEF